MMIEKIKLHNYLNGFAFSMAEFLIVAAVILPFTIYYFLNGKLLYGIVSLGIVLNSLLIVLFAANSLIKKEKDIGIFKFFDKKIRNEMNVKYPALQRDTTILTVLILLPFMLCLFCFIDLVKNQKK